MPARGQLVLAEVDRLVASGASTVREVRWRSTSRGDLHLREDASMVGTATARRARDGNGDGGRRALQVTLGTLAAIPCASGLAGMLIGPAALPADDSRVEASLDSEYRFTNAFWFAVAPLIWAHLPRIERESPVLRAALGTIVVGGLARAVSWRRTGRPAPGLVVAMGLELVVVPALAGWQHHVVQAHRRSSPTA